MMFLAWSVIYVGSVAWCMSAWCWSALARHVEFRSTENVRKLCWVGRVPVWYRWLHVTSASTSQTHNHGALSSDQWLWQRAFQTAGSGERSLLPFPVSVRCLLCYSAVCYLITASLRRVSICYGQQGPRLK